MKIPRWLAVSSKARGDRQRVREKVGAANARAIMPLRRPRTSGSRPLIGFAHQSAESRRQHDISAEERGRNPSRRALMTSGAAALGAPPQCDRRLSHAAAALTPAAPVVAPAHAARRLQHPVHPGRPGAFLRRVAVPGSGPASGSSRTASPSPIIRRRPASARRRVRRSIPASISSTPASSTMPVHFGRPICRPT